MVETLSNEPCAGIASLHSLHFAAVVIWPKSKRNVGTNCNLSDKGIILIHIPRLIGKLRTIYSNKRNVSTETR